MSKLILTADDYGLNPAVNAAVLTSIQNNAITSVQVLANYASESDIRLLAATIHAAGNKCGIGLHFCTTAGRSILRKASTLTHGPNFEFYKLEDWDYAHTNSNDVKEELLAQYKMLADIIGGHRIDSLSSHHNIHLFSPVYMGIIVKIAEAHQIPVRSPVRWSQDKKNKNYPGPGMLAPIEKTAFKTLSSCKSDATQALLSRAILGYLMRENRDLANFNVPPVRTPHSASGHWYGQPSKKAIEWTVGKLLEGPNGDHTYATEIFMHLANSTVYEDPSLTYLMYDRVVEYNKLNSSDVRNYIQTLYNKPGLDFGSYRKVLMGQKVSYDLPPAPLV